MTGWRLGWGVWPEKLVDHLFKFCVNNHSCVNAAIQYGAISALDGPEDSIHGMVKKFILRRNLMVDGLRKIKVKVSGGKWEILDQETTTWMFADTLNSLDDLLPFGWVVCEVVDL